MNRFFISIVAIAFTLTSVLHSGKTDGSGGHYNHSSGDYHYHHGYPAHDHYDVDGDGYLDCPYDFDDQTNHNNGGKDNYEKDYDEKDYDEKTQKIIMKV